LLFRENLDSSIIIVSEILLQVETQVGAGILF